MAHSFVDPSDSPEDFLAREGLLAGELSPDEFADRIVNRPRPPAGDEEPPSRREFTGPLYRRGEWSPLRRAWLCLQVAAASVGIAACLYFKGVSASFTIPLAAVGISSLSLGLLLLARSSAVHEIRALTRDRRRLRDQADAYALYAQSFARCVSSLAIEAPARYHSGAPLVRDLLARARHSLAAAGHKDATLLVLRHEPDRSLLTYSASPGGSLSDMSSGCRQLEPSALQSCRHNSVASHAVEFDPSDRPQELLALSSQPLRDCDRLALDQLAACLSLALATSLAHR